MTEASITQDLLTMLRARFGKLRVVKTSERFTKGIPDVYIVSPHTWLEVKLLKPGDSLRQACADALQRFTMLDYFEATGGRAWYVVYDARTSTKCVWIYEPDDVHAAVRGLPEDELRPVMNAMGFNHRRVAEFVMRDSV